MDWDNDGRKDLITGGRDGYVRIYLNTGTDADPAFSGYTNLQVGVTSWDAGYTSTPYIVDWNNDGKKDVICGEDSGRIWLLINVGTDASPIFSGASYILNGATTLDVGSRCSPVAADWNNYGKKDLVVGEYSGTVYYFENIGTDAAPAFNGSVLLQAGGAVLDVEYYARIDVVDWDNDGVLDLMSGNRNYSASPTGGIWFFHALGPLSLDHNSLSISWGGTIEFSIDAGAASAGRDYFLLGTASGTEPGTLLPGGATLPLNRDPVFNYIRANYNNAMLSNFRGTLDASGEAAATLSVPFVSFPVGTILHFAYTLERPFDYQSNAAAVEITY